MKFRDQIEVDRPADEVFAIYANVEQWPTWTRSVRSVKRLDEGPLAVGTTSRVEQPRLPVTDWTVTEVVPDRTFTWQAVAVGVRSIGRHHVQPQGPGCLVTAEFEQVGIMAPVAGLLGGRLIRRYLRMECEGIKAFAERGPMTPGYDA